MRRSIALAAVGILFLGLSACSPDIPVAPETEVVSATQPPVMSVAGLDPTNVPPPRYIVTYRGKAPRDLSAAVEAVGGSVDAVYERYGFAIVSGIDETGASDIAGVRGVAAAEAEPMFKLPEPLSRESRAAATPSSPAAPFAAFFFPIQWHLDAINVLPAWLAGRTGSPDVTLAILDTGIDEQHIDIQGHLDLARSAVFDHFDDPFVTAFFPGRPLTTDIHFHGTHVASVASSNAFAAAGVTSTTTLLAVKVCNITDACPGAAVLEGIVHAIENDADVINMSLGGDFDKSEKENAGFVSVINRLFNAAKQAGVTVVVAAGNDSADLDHNGNTFATYCDAPHVICVSATGPSTSANFFNGPWFGIDDPAFFTNFGRSAISVAAPGGNNGGFVLSACSSASLLIPACQAATSFVVWVAGTSQATPQVTGLAGLLVEDLGRNPSRIKNAIQNGADDLGQPGTDPFYGKGRINVGQTLGLD